MNFWCKTKGTWVRCLKWNGSFLFCFALAGESFSGLICCCSWIKLSENCCYPPERDKKSLLRSYVKIIFCLFSQVFGLSRKYCPCQGRTGIPQCVGGWPRDRRESRQPTQLEAEWLAMGSGRLASLWWETEQNKTNSIDFKIYPLSTSKRMGRS